jgi:hypothetical protein
MDSLGMCNGHGIRVAVQNQRRSLDGPEIRM